MPLKSDNCCISNQEHQAIPFVYLENQKFQVSKEAENFLNSLDRPVAVLTIVGKYRTGKSLLLNKVLLQRSKVFKVSPTVNSCTKGLWLWTSTLKVENQDKQVLVIDSQGFGATEQTDAYNNKILLFALLLSSYFIYNSVGSIDENSLNSISVIANLANEIQTKNAKDDGIEDNFPAFLWLVRDFTLNLVDKNNLPIKPKAYLENALQNQKGSSSQIESKNKIRRMMKHFFRDRDCYTLVRPVESEGELQNLDSLQFEDFREAFQIQSSTLRERILRKIKPKNLKGSVLNGQKFCELTKNYVDIVNDNSLPNFENSYKHLLKIEINNLKKKFASESLSQAKVFFWEMAKTVASEKQFYTQSHSFIDETAQNLRKIMKLMPTTNIDDFRMIERETNVSVHKFFDALITETYSQQKNSIRQVAIGSKEKMQREIKKAPEGRQIFYKHVDNLQNILRKQVSAKNNHCIFTEELIQLEALKVKEQLLMIFLQTVTDHHRKLQRVHIQNQQSHSNQIQELKRTQQNLQSELEKFKLLNQHFQDKCQELIKLQKAKDYQCHRLNQQITDLKHRNIRFEEDSAHLKQELQKVVRNNLCSLQEIDRLKDEKNYLEKQNSIMRCALEAKSSQIEEKKQSLQESKVYVVQKQRHIEVLDRKVEKLHEEIAKLNLQFQQTVATLHQRNVELEKQNSTLSEKLDLEVSHIREQSQQYAQMVEQLQQKSKQDSITIGDLSESNKYMSQVLSTFQEQIQRFRKVEGNLRGFKNCVKNSASMQCCHCTDFFMTAVFETHLSVCSALHQGNSNKKQKEGQWFQKQKSCIIKVRDIEIVTNCLDHLNQHSNKPKTVYHIECTHGGVSWTIQRQFKQICALESELCRAYPSAEFSKFRFVCRPEDVSKRSQDWLMSVAEKKSTIEKYLNDLVRCQKVTNLKLWKQFIQDCSDDSDLQICEGNECTEVLTQSKTQEFAALRQRDERLNQFMVAKSSEKSVKKGDNQNLEGENRMPESLADLHTPEQFFKVWEQGTTFRNKSHSVGMSVKRGTVKHNI